MTEIGLFEALDSARASHRL